MIKKDCSKWHQRICAGVQTLYSLTTCIHAEIVVWEWPLSLHSTATVMKQQGLGRRGVLCNLFHTLVGEKGGHELCVYGRTNGRWYREHGWSRYSGLGRVQTVELETTDMRRRAGKVQHMQLSRFWKYVVL